MRGKAPSLPPLRQYLHLLSSLFLRIKPLTPMADLTTALPYSSDLGMPKGRWETNMAFNYCVPVLPCCYTEETTSPLEGLPDLLPSPRGFAAFSPCLIGLGAISPRHVESRRSWWRREWGCCSTGWVMMGWSWGEKAPIGSHVIRWSSFKDAVEEVLQISGVGWACGLFRGRSEEKKHVFKKKLGWNVQC